MRFLAFLALFSIAAAGYPCTCEYPSFTDQVAEATAIFSGKMTEIEPAGNNQLGVQFEIIKKYRGSFNRNIRIKTAETTEACGYVFEVDQEYLVYATGNENFEVSLCSRTRLLKEASDDLDKLERGGAREADRDPFVEMKGEKFGRTASVPKELNVTNAVIVGITKKSDGYIALVRATNNKVYFLQVGDKLHDGVVLRIDSKAVTFRQFKGYRSVLVKKELRPFPD